MTDLLPIGEFAALARLSPRALRLYDREGLLAPAEVDGETGHRRYHPAQVRRARLIRTLRLADVPLADVAAALGGADEVALLDAHAARLRAEHEDRMARVAEARGRLLAGAVTLRDARIVARPAGAEVAVARDVALDELRDFVTGTLAGLAVEPAGPPFARFHRPVDEGHPGRVEVGFPVALGTPGARLRPAAQVACVRVRGEDARPPRLLAVYEALPEWAAGQGRRTAGPPEEHYLDAAGSDVEVCWPLR